MADTGLPPGREATGPPCLLHTGSCTNAPTKTHWTFVSIGNGPPTTVEGRCNPKESCSLDVSGSFPLCSVWTQVLLPSFFLPHLGFLGEWTDGLF